ncbi:hypothetical protein ACUTGZ_27665, partial [Klebsiella pneumoniae]|uniref:hypothetical protein n=1 Tax=Klebsiella pneumoniae TaxID=573 RepID=UPI00404593CF
ARCPCEIVPEDKIKSYHDILKDIDTKLKESRLIAALNLNESKYNTKEIYDRDAKSVHYREGQMVMVKNELKTGKHGLP